MPGDPERFGHAAALLAGDLAAVLADRLLLTSEFDPVALARALAAYHEMRLDMAAGQLLDVAGLASDPESALRAARLKGSSYTVEGPLVVGAELAGAGRGPSTDSDTAGSRSVAFQLRDDLHDREGRTAPRRRRSTSSCGRPGGRCPTPGSIRWPRRCSTRSHRRWRCHERRPRRPAAVLRRPTCRVGTVRNDGGPTWPRAGSSGATTACGCPRGSATRRGSTRCATPACRC